MRASAGRDGVKKNLEYCRSLITVEIELQIAEWQEIQLAESSEAASK